MPAYQLQIKQVVDYPRCRIYRQFIHRLIDDRSIRASGGSGLFYYTVLCSFANFRTSYRRIDGISYTVYPGEWVCTLKELSQWFRTRFQCQALSILGELQQRHLIDFSSLGRGNVIRYKIRNWARHNTVLEYNAPCQKDTGFFFLPVSIVTDLISSDRCSEMDIVLDLWVSAIYNDSQVQGSGLGPVAYFRNGTGNPLVTYTELAARWGLSRATVGRILKKLSALDYISLMSFPGRHGSVIYLKNYLSTMFEISDVMVDKEEVAMTLNIRLELPAEGCVDQEEPTMEHEVIVSDELSSVSKSHIEIIMQKMAQILMAQGISCFGCSLSHYKLYPLSGDCREELLPRAREQTVLRLLTIGGTPYRWIMDSELPPLSFADFNSVMLVIIGVCANGAVALITLILVVILAWNYLKLLLEAAERYVLLGVLVYTAPVAFAMGASQTTSNIWKSWCRMLGGQIFLLLMNAWCLRLFTSMVGSFISNPLSL